MKKGQNRSISNFSAVTLLLVWAIASPVAAAQDKAAADTYTNAGSDSAGSTADENAQAPSSAVAPQDRVLKKRSIFFPDLATSRAPLTANQKFRLFIKESIAPASLLGSAFGAGIDQATNTPSGYGQGAQGYGKRLGASLATESSKNFFGTFIIASIARQDPRFFVHGEGTFGQRIGHAISRVVVAPKDQGGYGFNWGGVIGPLGAEALANTYLPVREQTGARTMSRYGTGLAMAAGINVLKEFWPDIFKHLGLQK
jgi:hypothetical protein